MNWNHWEQNWYEKTSEHLMSHVALAKEVHDFVEHVATHEQIMLPPTTESRSVERILLRRLGEEYRSLELLAVRGHGFQAMSACANLFELAHMVGHIVNDDAEAARWLASNNRDRLPWSIKTLVTNNGRKIGWDAARVDEEYGRYGFLCGFKHNNPVFTRVLTLPGDADLYLAQFALAEGAHLALVAVGLVVFFRFEGEQCSTVLARSNDLFARAAVAIPSLDRFQ